MKAFESHIVYENPLPQLRSRQAFFPFLFEDNGKIGAVFAIGEAFESVDSTSYICFSDDGGKTFSKPEKMFDFSSERCPITDYCKVTRLSDGTLFALGYSYYRDNPDLPLGNPENGGLLDDFIFYSKSKDGGKTWDKPTHVGCAWGEHVEASAPIVELNDGTLMTPITGFPDWSGKMHSATCGRALVSRDGGNSWSDDAVCMDFNGEVTCYEQRICQLESGLIVNIGWNENLVNGERMDNHYTVSSDGGKTWSCPKSTGVRGQASSVCSLGGERLLALHAVRRDTDRPGIYAYVVDMSRGEWDVVDSALVWEPATPIVKDTKMAEIFAFLKFGQPGAILLSDGDVMMSHWFAEQGQYKVAATRISFK